MKNSRIDLTTTVTGLLLLAILIPGSSAAAVQPNLVLIVTDDQAHDAVGYQGRYPWLKTPNIDRLAAEGAVFENFFVTTSLCSPSRAAFLTGAYGHKNGVVHNAQSDPQLPIFPEKLQEAGYETAFVGKWHMANHARPRPGFNYWLSFRNQGQYFNPSLNENGREFQAEGYTTDILTDYSVNWLTKGRDARKPFCLCLMHKANHAPFQPAPRHQQAWSEAKLPRPASNALDMSDRPAWLRHSMIYGVHNKAFHANRDKPTPDRIPPGEWDEKSPKYLNHLRCILAVDDSVGRIYQALEKIGELDNTLIVFTSDNGYFLGEQRRGDKRLAYEESIRIPFCVRYPKSIQAGTRIDAFGMNIDIAPTFFELAGIRPLKQFQGRSLAPLFAGKTPADWREYVFYEYFQERYAPGIPTIFAVRTKDWKFIHHPDLKDEIDELYHLSVDPHEMKNLSLDSQYGLKLEEMRKLLELAKKEARYDRHIPPQF
jgi:N-acetylglucosamine-6-sulfatase